MEIQIKKSLLFLGFISLGTFLQCQSNQNGNNIGSVNYQELVQMIKKSGAMNGNGVNFVPAAAISTPCVVHIKTKQTIKTMVRHPFQDFFGNDFFFQQPGIQKQEGSGSGVIVHSDGYIATNNHVIQDADEIEVILSDKSSYKAKLIGTDKETDIALLKIEPSNLPTISFANSDSTQVGEWVLAVGNPFNLESTVTQGIVSAKGRTLNASNQRNSAINPIESFIQTDAAVNPGNSGGALVNLKGELIGINTAIASPTGAYAGYAFAVPSNLVKKVVQDIKEFGMVQRAYLGVSISNLTPEKMKELQLSTTKGVCVESIYPSGSAKDAGLEVHDVITKINNVEIKSTPELLEQIAQYRPGNEIQITLIRKGEEIRKAVVLKNMENNTSILKSNADIFQKLGIEVQSVSPQELRTYQIPQGVKVLKINNGIIAQSTDMKAGFVMTTLNNIGINSPEKLKEILSQQHGTVIVEGFYPNRPYNFQYAFKL